MKDFNAVGEFHKKFDLPVAGDRPPHELTDETFRFRLKFMIEELQEYADAHGYVLEMILRPGKGLTEPPPVNLPQAADSLIDLAYVVLGTAHMHGFPWAALFAEVQRANMSKERCGIDYKFVDAGHPVDLDSCDYADCGQPRVAHSLRGSALDVIKPKGFRPPRISEILLRAGWPGPKLPIGGKE